VLTGKGSEGWEGSFDGRGLATYNDCVDARAVLSL
jgi:hypothetical protein